MQSLALVAARLALAVAAAASRGAPLRYHDCDLMSLLDTLSPKAREVLFQAYLQTLTAGEASSAQLVYSQRFTPVVAGHRSGTSEDLESTAQELDRLFLEGQSALLERDSSPALVLTPRITDHFDTTLEVPLFDFSAPPHTGCTVKVQASNSRASAATWRIGFGVAGGEAANKVQVSFSAAFSAGPGECKRVFLPIKAGVDRLHLIRISKAPTRGAASSPDIRELLRADRPGVRRNDLLVRMPDQLRLLPASSAPIPSVRMLQRPHLNRGSEAANYPLAGDVSGAPAEYEYIQETTSDYRVSLGSEAHGVKVGATAGVAITNRLLLRISLAGGHNYRLMSMTDRPGIYWE